MQVLNLVFGIVLARLLTPADYGIVGVLAVFTMIAQELQTAGFTQALINLKEPQHKDYNSVFWFNITMSAFMYLVLFLSAPLIADFFHEPKLLWVSRFVFLAFFISSFGIVANAYMTKHLMMKEMAVIGIISLLCSGTVGIVLAFLNFSYWALAWQQITYITVYNIGRYIVVPIRPSLSFSMEPIKKMYKFAFNMMLTNIVNSLSMKILTFIFGRMLPMDQVGNYTQADKWNITASDTIRCAVNNVAQPVLAEVRDDKERTLRVLRKMMRFASFVSFPAMFGLALVSEIHPLYHWREMACQRIPSRTSCRWRKSDAALCADEEHRHFPSSLHALHVALRCPDHISDSHCHWFCTLRNVLCSARLRSLYGALLLRLAFLHKTDNWLLSLRFDERHHAFRSHLIGNDDSSIFRHIIHHQQLATPSLSHGSSSNYLCRNIEAPEGRSAE